MKIYVLWILFRGEVNPRISIHLEEDGAEDEVSEYDLDPMFMDSGVVKFDLEKLK